jgi:RHS repeat-associated protein
MFPTHLIVALLAAVSNSAPGTAANTAPASLVMACAVGNESISPCSASITTTVGVQQGTPFTIANNEIEDDAFTISLSGLSPSIATCTPTVSNLSVPSHQSRGFTVNCTGVGVGSGTLTVTAAGGLSTLTATVTVTVNFVNPMAVTPSSVNNVVLPFTVKKQAFSVQNTSGVSITVDASVICDAGETACSVSPLQLILPAGSSKPDTVTYTSGAIGSSGVATFKATLNGQPGVTSTGVINVSVPLPLVPVVSTAPQNGDNRAPGLCVVACFDAVISYSSPAYISLDAARSVTLFYSSAQAAPMGEVQLDVTDPSVRPALQFSLKLQRPDASFVTFTNGTTELFWNQATGNVITRIGGQFDASALATGVYSYTAIVKSWFGPPDNGVVKQTSVAVKVLILNERTSMFGAGWTLAGYHRLRFPAAPDNLTILDVDGAGGITRFTQTVTNGVATATAADWSTITTTLSGSTITGYKRIFPNGDTLYYSAAGYMLLSKNRFNDSTRYHYNGTLVDSIIDPAGKGVALMYTGNGLATITDPGGRVSMFNVQAGTGDVQSITDPTGTVTFTGTYVAHRLTQRVDRSGTNTWLVRYDFAGKIASDSTPPVWADSATARIGTKYVSLQSQALIDPASGKGSTTNAAAQVRSDSIRLLVIPANGDTARYAVDRFGAPTLVESPRVKTSVLMVRDLNSLVTKATTTAKGRVVSKGATTWSGPLVVSSTDSLTGATIDYTYDSKYGLLTDVTGATIKVKDFLNNAKSWVDSTRLGTCTVQCADSMTRYTHEAHGRISKVVDQQLDTTWYVFALPNGTSQSLIEVHQGPRTTMLRRDIYGRVEWVMDARGDTVRISMDSLNRTRSTKGAQGAVVSYAYDLVSLRSVTDAQGQVYSYYSNPVGWIDSTVNANTGDPASNRVDKYEYWPTGTLKAHVNRRGQRTRLTYDQQGRLLTRKLSNDSMSYFAYDTAGLWVAARNGESVDTISTDTTGLWQVQKIWRGTHWYTDSTAYDNLGLVLSYRVKAESGVLSNVSYGYDVNHQPTSLVVDGLITFFTTNRDGLLTNLRLPTALPQDIAFGLTKGHQDYSISYSGFAGLDAPLGVYYRFDSLDRITQRIKRGLDSTRTWAYDSLGRLTQYQMLQDTSALTCNDDLTGYAGRICTSAHGQKVVSQATFAYNAVGNPTDGGAQLAAGNRLTIYNGYTLTYDYDGNLVHKQKGSFDQYLYWNSIGQLDSVKTGTVMIRFGYDALGRRVRKTTPTQTLRYIYADGQVVAEIDAATNTAVRVYSYYGLDSPHAVKTSSGSYYYIAEGAGNVIALIDVNRTIVNRYRYSAFGQLEDSSEAITNPIRFAGREYDSETQLYYNRARYYDPALHRFVSEDPIGLSGGINQFAYAGNDPMNQSDPSGTNVFDHMGRGPCRPLIDGLCNHGGGGGAGGGAGGGGIGQSVPGGDPDAGLGTYACAIGVPDTTWWVTRDNWTGSIVRISDPVVTTTWGSCGGTAGGSGPGATGSGSSGGAGGAGGANAPESTCYALSARACSAKAEQELRAARETCHAMTAKFQTGFWSGMVGGGVQTSAVILGWAGVKGLITKGIGAKAALGPQVAVAMSVGVLTYNVSLLAGCELAPLWYAPR